jgi:phosphohistidine phosphatase
MMPTLLVMRHGKSDWGAPNGADHDRPLAERGVRSARLIGRLLTGLDLAPHFIISSTAVRARTTAELAAAAGGWDAPISLQPGFYGGSTGDVLGLAAREAPDVDRLMLVGHEPTWSGLVEHLTGARVPVKTGTVAVIDVEAAHWSALPEARGELMALRNPRDYFDTEWDEG